MSGPWKVTYSNSARKAKNKLPLAVVKQLAALTWDLERSGPVQPDWTHYSPLKKGKNLPHDSHHCHIKSGRPTYVVCWYVLNREIKILEVFYVGTHENAPY